MIAGHHHDANAGGLALGDRLRNVGPHRVFQRDQPEEGEVEVVLQVGQHRRHKGCPGHAQHPQAVACHRVNLIHDGGALRRVEMAEIDDGFRRALAEPAVAAVAMAHPMQQRYLARLLMIAGLAAAGAWRYGRDAA